MMLKDTKYFILNFIFVIILVTMLLIPQKTTKDDDFELGFSEEKRVLLVSSYSPSFETFFQEINGVKSQFDSMNIVLDIEFMDSKRFFEDNNLENFYNSIKHKINSLPPYDVILTADDNALNFVLDKKQELFKDIPIVFFGINSYETATEASKSSLITGILEDVSIYDTIELAHKLNSNAENVVAIVDNTVSGQADLEEYYKESNKFDDLEFHDLDLSDYSFNEYSEKLHMLDENDIVLLLSLYSDKNQDRVSFKEGLNYLLYNCKQPIYHLYYHGIGNGLLGGKVISHFDQGKRAGGIAIDILKGISKTSMSYAISSENKYIFDYNIIKKYDINEKYLPAETQFINKKVNIFEEYKGFFTSVLIFFIFLLLTIIILIYNITRKNIAEKELKEKNILTSNLNLKLKKANIDLINITEKIKQQNEKIKKYVYIDSLSGLKNRFAIESTIAETLKLKKERERIAVIFIDIDNFKNINDSYGHDVGDIVISILGSKLVVYQNENATIGRFGGDEFLILLRNIEVRDQLLDFCKIIQDLFSEPIKVVNNSLYITVSIGIIYNTEMENMHSLIKKADLALYKAKLSGKNNFIIYDDSIEKEFLHNADIQRQILKAIRNNSFFLNYQPLIDVKTSKIVAFEALIRLNDENNIPISAFEIIKNAEDMGVIITIGEWVIEHACKFCKKINSNRDDKIAMSINVSAKQLNNSLFPSRLVQIIKQVDIDPGLISLEITESALIESIENGRVLIEKFRDYGFSVSMDDFGTGYSSLTYFKELPVDVLKIDKTFIDNITTSTYEQHLISAISKIAHEKNMLVVAEGVETENQLDYAKKLGCDIIQGYFFSRPMKENDAYNYVQK